MPEPVPPDEERIVEESADPTTATVMGGFVGRPDEPEAPTDRDAVAREKTARPDYTRETPEPVGRGPTDAGGTSDVDHGDSTYEGPA